MRHWLTVGCVVLFTATTAQADPFGGLASRWNWWADPQMRQELKLSEEQVSRIQEIIRAKRGGMIDLKGAMEKKALLLADEVERSDFDLPSALAAAEEFQKAQGELQRYRMGLLLEVRGVITLEQFLKLRATQRSHRWRQMREHRERWGGGGPPHRGPED